MEPENCVSKVAYVDSLQSNGKKSIMGLIPMDGIGIQKGGGIMHNALNVFLKDIMGFIMEIKMPTSIPEISKGLNEHECLVTSAIRTLEDLGLVKESADSRFMLSEKGATYMSLSELEQHIYEKKNPFVLYKDENGTVTSFKPKGWDIEE